MQSQGVYLLLPSPAIGNYATYAYCGQKSKGRLYFSANSTLIATMKQQDNIVDNNDIDTIPSLVSLTDNDRQALARNNIELLVPLKNEGKLAGLLLLSNKISREPYS